MNRTDLLSIALLSAAFGAVMALLLTRCLSPTGSAARLTGDWRPPARPASSNSY